MSVFALLHAVISVAWPQLIVLQTLLTENSSTDEILVNASEQGAEKHLLSHNIVFNLDMKT